MRNGRAMQVVGSLMGDDTTGGATVQLPPKPDWREGQVAPGVMLPDEGLFVLPLTAEANNGLFTATVTQIQFSGKQQKPFRAERFLMNPLRTGSSAVGILFGTIFVGTDLQQATNDAFDLELICAPNSFGTRLTCTPAEPGIITKIPMQVVPPPTSEDSILVSIIVLGRIVA